MLFVQGARDSFGTPSELRPILTVLSPPAALQVVAGGDHSFKVARASQQEQAEVFGDVQRTVVEWIRRVMASAASGTHQPLR